MAESNKCKDCGRTTLPGQEYCPNCKPPQPRGGERFREANSSGQRGNSASEQRSGRVGSSTRYNADDADLPSECMIRASFYEADGYLKASVFMSAAEESARAFRRAQITQTSIRRIHGQAKDAQLRLKGPGGLGLGFVRETVGKLVVLTDYQVGRRKIPRIFKTWLDSHADIAMRNTNEYCGFVDFFTSIVARLRESEREDRR